MSDVRSLGSAGKTLFDGAQKLRDANLITDAQMKELQNPDVGPQDMAIASKALDDIKADTPNGMNLMFSIPGMQSAINKLQLNKTVQSFEQRKDARQQGGASPEIDFSKIFDALKDAHSAIRNIRQ